MAFPKLRTGEWHEERERVVRSKAGKIERGMVDAFGEPQVPYTDHELDLRASSAIAHVEATELMFDFEWKLVCRLEQRGIALL